MIDFVGAFDERSPDSNFLDYEIESAGPPAQYDAEVSERKETLKGFRLALIWRRSEKGRVALNVSQLGTILGTTSDDFIKLVIFQ